MLGLTVDVGRGEQHRARLDHQRRVRGQRHRHRQVDVTWRQQHRAEVRTGAGINRGLDGLRVLGGVIPSSPEAQHVADLRRLPQPRRW